MQTNDSLYFRLHSTDNASHPLFPNPPKSFDYWISQQLNFGTKNQYSSQQFKAQANWHARPMNFRIAPLSLLLAIRSKFSAPGCIRFGGPGKVAVDCRPSRFECCSESFIFLFRGNYTMPQSSSTAARPPFYCYRYSSHIQTYSNWFVCRIFFSSFNTSPPVANGKLFEPQITNWPHDCKRWPLWRRLCFIEFYFGPP